MLCFNWIKTMKGVSVINHNLIYVVKYWFNKIHVEESGLMLCLANYLRIKVCLPLYCYIWSLRKICGFQALERERSGFWFNLHLFAWILWVSLWILLSCYELSLICDFGLDLWVIPSLNQLCVCKMWVLVGVNQVEYARLNFIEISS